MTKALGNWEHFFKPEVRAGGSRYLRQVKVSFSQASDTEIQGVIRTSTLFKVRLKSTSISSPVLNVSCTCPTVKKRVFCKHIWAILLAVDEKCPEFFEEKNEISLQSVITPDTSAKANRPLSESQIEKQAAFKAKQVNYRKQQYQRLKEKMNEKKQVLKRGGQRVPAYPKHVEEALAYFEQNGFSFVLPLKTEVLQLAKKKLSRIFHPDVGGSHAEIVELNTHVEVLLNFSN